MPFLIKTHRLLLGIMLIGAVQTYAQQLYSPQIRYNTPGGLFDIDSIRTISINFYESNYHDTLVANWYADNGKRLPAAITLSNGIVLDSVATRYKGNSTFNVPEGLGNPKLPLNLDFNDFISGQKLMGYKKMKLANALFDPTFAKEIAAYNIYKRYLPSPEANLINVKVQGDLLGLYVNTEPIDKQFLTKHFDEKNGVLFKCDPIQQFGQPGPTGSSDLDWLGADSSLYFNSYSLKSDYGWNALVDLIDKLNNNPEQLDQVLNIDRVLWAFAVNMAVANLDTYNGLYQHNYYFYQTGDGLFQMIPWDVSESFLGALMGSNPDPNLLYEYDPYNGYNCWWYPLISQLISDPNSFYGQLYTAHLRTIIEESLDANTIGNYVNQLQNLGYSSADADDNKLFDMFCIDKLPLVLLRGVKKPGPNEHRRSSAYGR
ncbi:CotH kinase family protein [Flavobacteriales bacterium]|nr:CotH kinase family protein [Flavobacteriales bacterium]